MFFGSLNALMIIILSFHSTSLLSKAANQTIQKRPTYSKVLAKEIIDRAEKIRTLDQAKTDVAIETVSSGKKTSYRMDVLQSTGKRAYIEFTSPAEEKGRRMLAIKTRYLSKFPDSKRVVPISRREAIGNSAFAIADVFQMDTEMDFTPTVVGEEKIDQIDCYIVQLDAKHSDAPYKKIVYRVKKKDSYPVTADFFGDSGQILKTMTVLSSKVLAGLTRPSILKMVDKTTDNKFSIWETISAKKMSVPDQVFTESYLKSR